MAAQPNIPRQTDDARQSSARLIRQLVGSDAELPHAAADLASRLDRDGYALTRTRLLPTSTCSALRDRTLPRLFRGDFDTGVYPDEWHWREGLSLPDATREMCNAWKSDRTVASVVLSEEMGKLVAAVMGWESVRIAQDDVVWKVPTTRDGGSDEGLEQEGGATTVCGHDGSSGDGGSAVVGHHQDSAYISKQFVPYENNSVTVWMALDDADSTNGCVEYAVGSHRWRPLLHLQERGARGEDDGGRRRGEEQPPSSASSPEEVDGLASFHGSDEASYRDGLRRAAELSGAQGSLSVLPAEVSEGCAILHHQDVWHGSGPNWSKTRHRRALVAHYLRGDVRFRGGNDGSGGGSAPWGSSSYIYGRYRKHGSTEVDEDFFPIIYASAESDQERTPWLHDYLLSTPKT